ncbi:unnamed protein product [Phaeothamnion confervicola]
MASAPLCIYHGQDLPVPEPRSVGGFFWKWKDMADAWVDSHVSAPRGQLFQLQRRQWAFGFVDRPFRILLLLDTGEQMVTLEAVSVQMARNALRALKLYVFETSDYSNGGGALRTRLATVKELPDFQYASLLDANTVRFPSSLLQPMDRLSHPCDYRDFDADLILVHGLGGDPNTWENEIPGHDKFQWIPFWLLDEMRGRNCCYGIYELLNGRCKYPDVPALPPARRVRVLVVKHGATLKGTGDDADPQKIAINLAGALAEAGVGAKPVVWLTHSLGGLITKELLKFAAESRANDLTRIVASTKGIVFYGTPHHGNILLGAAEKLFRTTPAGRYMDPSVSRVHLAELNGILAPGGAAAKIEILNFIEGSKVPLLWGGWGESTVIVPDADARLSREAGFVNDVDDRGNSRVSTAQAEHTPLPWRVNVVVEDRHHNDIHKPPKIEHVTFSFVRSYVARWLALRDDGGPGEREPRGGAQLRAQDGEGDESVGGRTQGDLPLYYQDNEALCFHVLGIVRLQLICFVALTLAHQQGAEDFPGIWSDHLMDSADHLARTVTSVEVLIRLQTERQLYMADAAKLLMAARRLGGGVVAYIAMIMAIVLVAIINVTNVATAADPDATVTVRDGDPVSSNDTVAAALRSLQDGDARTNAIFLERELQLSSVLRFFRELVVDDFQRILERRLPCQHHRAAVDEVVARAARVATSILSLPSGLNGLDSILLDPDRLQEVLDSRRALATVAAEMTLRMPAEVLAAVSAVDSEPDALINFWALELRQENNIVRGALIDTATIRQH